MTFYASPTEAIPAGLGSDYGRRTGHPKPRSPQKRPIRPLPLPRAPEGLSGPHMASQGPSRRGMPREGLPADLGASGGVR
jgi:hypothetical protein